MIKILTVDHYINDMRANLAVESPQLIRRLGQLLEFKFNPHIELLDFEMFVEPTRHEISIRMFSMDSFANEVFGEWESGFSGSTEVVDDVLYYSLVPGVNDDNLDEEEYVRLENEFNKFYQATRRMDWNVRN